MANKKNKQMRRRQTWEDWYLCAKIYAEEHGNLLIHRDYVTPNGFKLGRWIERQRAAYNNVGVFAGRLDKVQIEVLNEIGMEWKCVEHTSWDQWMEAVRDYYYEHGDLMVPHAYKTKDGVQLGEWISNQRRFYLNGELTREQLDDLDYYDMVWYIGNRKRDWMDWYKDCIAYFEAHGDLRVPVSYVTETGQSLGTWICVQRERGANKPPRTPLSDEERRMLDLLHMVWDLDDVRDDNWEQMYTWVSEYKAQNGKLPVWPRGIKAPDGRGMDSWISVQRANLRKGKYDRERIDRLAQLGIVPPVPRPAPEEKQAERKTTKGKTAKGKTDKRKATERKTTKRKAATTKTTKPKATKPKAAEPKATEPTANITAPAATPTGPAE